MGKQKRAIKKHARNFQYNWLDDDIFKGWLAPDIKNNKASCMLCNTKIRCNRTDLVRHSKRAKHIEMVKNDESLNNNIDNNSNKISHNDSVKLAEIKLASFFAEHNIAFYTADHLTPLIKNIFKDSAIAHDFSFARSKATSIIKNVIAKREIEKLVEYLKKYKFSILIDESTDISESKIMCILVQFFSPEEKIVKTQLLELAALDAKNCSANMLFQKFKDILNSKDIPITNIVGMASDNASVMTGCNNLFFSRLQLETSGVVLLNCICHSSAIIASRACEKLPDSCENLVRGIATYISGSAKRCAILTEFQEFFQVERQKILRLCNTRWLVLQNCVIRILDQWEVLKTYFILATIEDKSKSAEVILTQLNDNVIKSYLLFLKYSLNYFNKFNALFQSRKTLIHTLYANSQQLILQIALNFIPSEALKNISLLTIDDKNDDQYLNHIRLGSECEDLLTTLSLECAREIKLNCLNFYKTAVREMMKRLPYKDTFFEHLSFLEPTIALFHEGRNKIRNLSCIASRIGHLDVAKIEREWTILPTIFNETEKTELACLNINEMWAKILERKDFDGEKIFQNLELLVQAVLSFPHSNAEAERIFSIVSDVKNKKRNKLSVETISAISIVRSSFQAHNVQCMNFEPDSRHLELHNSQNLYETSDL